MHTDRLPLHTGEAAYGPGGVGTGHYAAVLGGLAAGDLFHDGSLDVVADDMDGNVYAWNGHGQLVFHAHSNPAYSGRAARLPGNPTGALDSVRHGPRDRTEGGFLSAPGAGQPEGRRRAAGHHRRRARTATCTPGSPTASPCPASRCWSPTRTS